MKLLKLAAIPAALFTTAAMAQDVVVVEPVAVKPVGFIANTTNGMMNGTKTFFETATHPASISAEIGTLGYGANIGWSVNDKTELQLGWNGGDLGDIRDNIDIKDANYTLETDFSNPYLAVQMRPMGNWFTIGAGTIFPDDTATLTANDNASTKVNGVTYSGRLDATVENKNSIAPFATLGFHPNLNNNWGLFADVGAAYTGGLKVTEAKVNGVQDASFESNLQKDLDDSDYSDWMPIVKAGVTYRF